MSPRYPINRDLGLWVKNHVQKQQITANQVNTYRLNLLMPRQREILSALYTYSPKYDGLCHENMAYVIIRLSQKHEKSQHRDRYWLSGW